MYSTQEHAAESVQDSLGTRGGGGGALPLRVLVASVGLPTHRFWDFDRL